MRKTEITVTLALMTFLTIGNFTSGSTKGGLIMGCVLAVFTYLAFISKSAVNILHFTIGRYITTCGIAVAIFLIFFPIFLEISGGFGDFLWIVSGMIVLFPTLVFREAIMHRKKRIFDTESAPAETTITATD